MAQQVKSKPLEILERIVRNLPIRNTEYWYVDTTSGRLYFALGIDSRNAYHGVWGFLRGPGMAQPLEFAPNQPKALVVKRLLEAGAEMLLAMEAKGLLIEGAWSRA